MPVHEKISLLDIEKTRYRYLAFGLLFHFLVIFFHVYICETYATLDKTEGKVCFIEKIKLNNVNATIALAKHLVLRYNRDKR